MVTGASSRNARTSAVEILRALGYRVTGVSVAGLPSFAEEVFLAVQFGNAALTLCEGVPTMPVTAALRLGVSGSVSQVTRWSVGKSFVSPSAGVPIGLSLQCDVTIAGQISTACFERHIREGLAQLKTLIQDVRETLDGLPCNRNVVPMRHDPGPAVHIEIVSLGDLVASRTGLLKSPRIGFTADEVGLRLRACDVLEYDVLSDLAAALHAVDMFSLQPLLPISGGEMPCRDRPRGSGSLAARAVDRPAATCPKTQDHL